MERETGEDKSLPFATLVSYTRSVPLRVVCHEHVSYHVVLCQLNCQASQIALWGFLMQTIHLLGSWLKPSIATLLHGFVLVW